MGKLFDGKLVFTQIPLLLKYLPVTMELAVTAMIASLILGLLLALVKIKKVLRRMRIFPEKSLTGTELQTGF